MSVLNPLIENGILKKFVASSLTGRSILNRSKNTDLAYQKIKLQATGCSTIFHLLSKDKAIGKLQSQTVYGKVTVF